MSDHLPECPCNHADERGCFLISAETDRCVDCICPQLRACEQRVREDERTSDYTGISAAMHTERMRENYERGLGAGLDAAEAVVARWFADNRDEMGWPDFLDAMDAARGDVMEHIFTLDEYEDVKRRAYAAGLRDARDVVAAFEPLLDISKHKGGYDCCGCSTTYELHEDALAAIDLLRGES